MDPIHLNNLQCNGSELRLNACNHSMGRTCSHSEDAGVICRGKTCTQLTPYVCDVLLFEYKSLDAG